MSTRSYVVGGVAVAAVLGVGYMVYFDHKRRSDPQFRKQLRQQRNQAARQREADEAAERLRAQSRTKAPVGVGVDIGADDPVPTSNEERGEYFMKQLQTGETLLARGPSAYEEAANHFFSALRIYPEPMNLLMVFQQSLPEPVLNIIMEKMAADVRAAQDAGASVEEIEIE
ncbi:hypothetical protein HK104_001006 [Borealophlyctis nickersoniae]|nr:hypothetical protein HK104_001006 [Borealophlyctis nickersoniae]